jgi:hypothetical protein
MSVNKCYCLDCGRELTPDEKACPNCGSVRRHIRVTVYEQIKLRESVKVKVKDEVGKTARKFLSRNKISKHGKEAKEELSIDIRGDRKYHHVEEQDESGRWVTVHHEDQILKKKKEDVQRK